MKHFLIALFAAFFITACSPSRDKGQSNTTDWQSSYDSLAAEYHNLRNAYAQDTSKYSPEFRMMFNQMQHQWIQMQAMHQQMTGGGMGSGMMGNKNGGMMNGQGMRGSSMMGGNNRMMRFREMNQQMLSYCAGMQQSMGIQNGMAVMLARMQQYQKQLLNQLPNDTTSSKPAQKPTATALNGATLFTNNCSVCHGADASGMPGVFPPLNGSPVAKGDKTVLMKVVLRGLQGSVSVNGKTYTGMMPSFRSMLSNEEIAAVLTYIRSLPENNASAVTSSEVAKASQATNNHTSAYAAQELGLQ